MHHNNYNDPWNDLNWGDNPQFPFWKTYHWPAKLELSPEEELEPVSKEDIEKIIQLKKDEIFQSDKKSLVKHINENLKLGNLSVKIEKNLINDLDSLPKIKKIYEEKGWTVKETAFETVVIWDFS